MKGAEKMNTALVLRSESPRIPPTSFSFAVGTFTLGRSSKCDFVVLDDTISRRHANIIVSKTSVNVCDLDSRNGIFIDSDRVKKGTLKKGQRIRFGSVAFVTMLAATIDEPDSAKETATCSLQPPIPETG